MPDRDVRRVVLTAKDGREFHFDGIAAAVTDRTLGADGHNQVVVNLGGALLNRSNDVLSEVSGKPLVDGHNLSPQTLQLVDGHRPDFKDRAREEVLNALLCG